MTRWANCWSPKRYTLKLEWYELCPHEGVGDDTDTILDHIHEFVLHVGRRSHGVRIHIRTHSRYRVLLDSLGRVESIPDRIPEIGWPVSYRYQTARHTALPVAPSNATKVSIYRILADAVSEDASLTISARRAILHPRISRYIQSQERGLPADGMLAMIYRLAGSRSAPGPSHIRNAGRARKKADSRHLFRCNVIIGAASYTDVLALESVFPTMAFVRRKIRPKTVPRLIRQGPGEPILGGSRAPILSDAEIKSFVSLPDDTDMASVPLNMGLPKAHSGGRRIDAADIADINIDDVDSSKIN